MSRGSKEQLLELIRSFNAARKRGALDRATSIASELFPALSDHLKTFTANLYRNLSDSDHEDIVQDVLMSLINNNYAKLTKTTSLSYLYSICSSRGRDMFRRKTKVFELDSMGDEDFEVEIPASPDGNPDAVHASNQRESTLQRICATIIPDVIRTLPAPYREIAGLVFVDMAYQDGKISNEALFETLYQRPPTDADTAEMDNLRQRKSRARRKLLDELISRTKDDPEAWTVVKEFEVSCHN